MCWFSSRLALVIALLAIGQIATPAHAAQASAGFAVTVQVVNACEVNGTCAQAVVRSVSSGTATNASGTVTPIVGSADSATARRVNVSTAQGAGLVEIAF